MEPTLLPSAVESIGKVLGYPAVVLVMWLYSQVKELRHRVDVLEHDNNDAKKTLSDIRSDVSFIRGKMERRSNDKKGV